MRALFSQLFQPLTHICSSLQFLLLILSEEAYKSSFLVREVLRLLQKFDVEYKLLFKCFLEYSQFAGESNASLPIFDNVIFSNLFKLQGLFSANLRSAYPVELDLADSQEAQFPLSDREDQFPFQRLGRASVSPKKRFFKEETKVPRPHTSTGIKNENGTLEMDRMCELSGIEIADLKAPPSAFMPIAVHRSLSRRSIPKRHDESESVSVMTRETWQRGGGESGVQQEEEEPQSQEYLFQTRSKLGESQANETINSSKGFLEEKIIKKEEGRRSLLERY